MNKTSSLQGIAYFLIILTLITYILVIGKFILVPLAFASLFTLMFMPLAELFERLLHSRIIAIILAFLIILIPVAALITALSYQVVDVFKNIPDISLKFRNGIGAIFDWLQDNWGITREQGQKWIQENFSKILDAPLAFIQTGITSSTTFLVNTLITLIITFLMMMYRKAMKNFILIQSPRQDREETQELLTQIQHTIRHYLYGLLIVIGILAILNSFGLWMIGINYPIFWGVMGAILAIIPYIGTTLGGLLPFIYSIPTADFWWQPLAVIILYSTIQTIEGNLITPNVVGSNIKVNAMMAIIAMIIGGVIWGIAGIILALPVLAIIKLLCDHTTSLKPIGLLLSDEVHKKENMFLTHFDEDKYRLFNWLKNK